MNEVYSDWAEALQENTIGSINYGLMEAKKEQHPPSQGEFIAHCKRYNPNEGVMRLDNKMSTEQIEKNKERIAAIVRKFSERTKA